MRSSLIQGLIVFLMISLSFSTFGKPEKTPPSHSFLKAVGRLFKSRKDKQAQCGYNDGKCLFVRDPNASGNSSNDNTLQQCAWDLCGPPEVSIHSYSYFDSDIERFVETDLMKEWEQEFQDIGIEDIIKDLVDKELGSFDRLQKAFQESDMSRKFGLDYLKPEDYHELISIFFRTYAVIDIDKTRPPSERLIIHTRLPKEASEKFKEGLKLYDQELKKQINTSFKEQVSHGIYTKQEVYTILKDKWENFINRYEQEKKSNDSFDKDDSLLREMDEIREDMEQLAEDTKDLSSEENQLDLNLEAPGNTKPIPINVARNIEQLEQSFIEEKTGSQPETEKQLLCQKKACQKALNEIIKELFSQYEKPFPRKDRTDRYSAQCLSKFVQLRQLERELPRGLNVPDIKKNFLDTVLKNFSKPTRKSFEDYTNDIYIGPHIPTTPRDFKTHLEDLLTENPTTYREYSASYYTNPNEKRDNMNLIIDIYESRFSNFKEKPPCAEFSHKNKDIFLFDDESKISLPHQVKDMSSKETISLSIFSCLHSHFGQSMASHEMGHLLSWMFSQNKLSNESYGLYKNLRECATKRYKHFQGFRERLPFIHENDQGYTEEDTADLIAYMAYPNSKTIPRSCFELPITEDGSQYKHLDILNNNPIDSHSSHLLRVLFEAIHKRAELSPACKQIIEQYKDDIDFTPCF